MITVEESIEIPRPIADVYRFVITEHAANHPRWDPDVVSVQKVSPGEVGVGTRFTMGRTWMGRVQESALLVTDCEPQRRVVMRSETRPLDLDFDNEFESRDGATRLTFRAHVKPHGPLNMMTPIIGDQFRKGLRRSLENVRRLMTEADTATVASDS